jgi:hypothetical protein
MNRPGFVVTAVVVTALSWSCRGPNPDELPEMVGVEGCLTASGDDLVLTRLTSSGNGSQTNQPDTGTTTGLPAPQATQMFTLKGMEDELRPHVGRQVRVRGEAHAPEVAVLRQRESPAPAGPAGTTPSADANGSAGNQAQVTTMQKTRFEATELTVRAVTPLNRSCEAL